jgi:DUF971 family protein
MVTPSIMAPPTAPLSSRVDTINGADRSAGGRLPGARRADRCNNRTVSTGTVSDPTTPVRIHADRSAGTLEVDWADGHRSTFDAVGLRWLCPCAYCRGEAGMPGWLDTGPALTADQTRLADVHLVGSYAIAPSWADGHHTGYYPFVLLRDRCPCPSCTAGRPAAATPRYREVNS